ncbi:MAG: hypothetical protein MR051_00765 [Lentisphaeria bacterium]|nr:hypothetical protein [Lentisphaeria bacterium]
MKYGMTWDEFQWEQEIRRHESRVAKFFQGLVYCIDLPAEEACANFQPGAPSDPVSARSGGGNPALQEWLRTHDDEEEDETAPPERRPVCLAPVDAVDQLCVKWNILAASQLRSDLTAHGMGVSCAMAKLLARVADFTEPGKDTAPALLLTLGKRSLADLKELSAMLELLSVRQKSLLPEVAAIQSRLLIVREQLTDRLKALRASR